MRKVRECLDWPNQWLNRLDLWRKRVTLEETPTIYGRLYLRGNGSITMGRAVKINSAFWANSVGLAPHTSLETFAPGRLIIGSRVGLSNCVISAKTLIQIGSGVFIGGGVQIFDHDFHSLYATYRRLRPDPDIQTRPIVIGDEVFIGTRSIITKGSTIGARSVIGAGSVVSGTVPPDEIWAGNPARFIKKIYPLEHHS